MIEEHVLNILEKNKFTAEAYANLIRISTQYCSNIYLFFHTNQIIVDKSHLKYTDPPCTININYSDPDFETKLLRALK